MSALCAKPERSTGYFNGYEAAQSDFHAGHPQNQNVTSASSNYISDYKQGYKDGWNDAQDSETCWRVRSVKVRKGLCS